MFRMSRNGFMPTTTSCTSSATMRKHRQPQQHDAQSGDGTYWYEAKPTCKTLRCDFVFQHARQAAKEVDALRARQTALEVQVEEAQQLAQEMHQGQQKVATKHINAQPMPNIQSHPAPRRSARRPPRRWQRLRKPRLQWPARGRRRRQPSGG